MRQGRLQTLGALILTALSASFAAGIADAQAKPASGRLTGVVRDTAGVPQMGASVEVVPEATGALSSRGFLTNTQGIFNGEKLSPGLYTIRVTLAGFLPTLQQHVRINPRLTTMVRVELESIFASLDQLRRSPINTSAEPDDWKWVLRSATGMRPILQWNEGGSVAQVAGNSEPRDFRPRARVEFTDGARRPGSVSNLASSPSTAFAYDQKLGGPSRLILAGQMSYEGEAPAGGIATVWLPTGSIGAGPHTALVLREAKTGPGDPVFRGVRMDQGGATALNDNLVLRYGAEYILVGLGSAVSSLRPRMELDARITENWHASLIYGSLPGAPGLLDGSANESASALASALNELDAFPALLWRQGRPVLQSGRHEEIAVERKTGAHGKLQLAAFHDDNRHVAIFGQGRNLPTADFFQDYFSGAFAYDGGSSGGWGGRVAFKEQLDGDVVELTAVYAFAGALAPGGPETGSLRDSLRTAEQHSLGANVGVKLPRSGTKLRAGYKWISGPVVSRVDPYGESMYQMDPFLHFSVRQPLPKFGPGRWEAIADYNNLFQQGYVTLDGRDGKAVLVPAFRTFRGGVSLQF